MIKKFIRVSRTGKFLNYQDSLVPTNYRSPYFKRLNLIYGENESEKTTPSTIFKSLRGNDKR
jgi:hypothetical protein